VLGTVPTSGPTLDERLDAAVAARRLSSGKALVYSFYAVNRDPRVPLELRERCWRSRRGGSAARGGRERRLAPAGAEAPPRVVSAYHRVPVDDRAVREIRFRNGNTGAGVLAALRLADGSRKLEDWSGRAEVTLCRDNASEDVQELLIASVNKNQSGSLGAFTHELRGRNACRLPSYAGTFSAVATYDETDVGAGNSLTARWSGSVRFTPATEEELRFSFSSIPYRIAEGSVSYQMRGRVDDCD
jgi:hypothetical protein